MNSLVTDTLRNNGMLIDKYIAQLLETADPYNAVDLLRRKKLEGDDFVTIDNVTLRDILVLWGEIE